MKKYTIIILAILMGLVSCNVPKVEVKEVEITGETQVFVGKSITLNAKVTPDNATDKIIKWSSSKETIATVKDGKVTGLKPGKTVIYAISNENDERKDIHEVEVLYEKVNSVIIKALSTSMNLNSEIQLNATVSPTIVENSDVQWSTSDETLATVDENGLVKSTMKSGEVTITVTSKENNNISDQVKIIINNILNVTGVSLNKTTLTMTDKSIVKLSATVEPTGATQKDVKWKSNNSSIASVDDNGNVIANSPGTAIITVTTEDGAKTATCHVTVNKLSVTSIKILDCPITMNLNDTKTLEWVVYPINATDTSVTWSSSDDTIVTVDLNGKLASKGKEGFAKITATSNDNNLIIETCQVSVAKPIINVTGVTLDNNSLTLFVGDARQLTGTVAPDDATNKNINWITNKPDVATVDSNGKVTAVAVGEAIITAKTEDGEKTDTCNVTVNKPTIQVSEFNINPTSKTLEKGDKYIIAFTILPNDATNQTINWNSSNSSVVSVSDSGEIEGLSTSTEPITITGTTTDGSNISAKLMVTVTEANVPVTGFKISPSNKTMAISETYTIQYTITPENATNQEIAWNSSDEACVKVSNEGIVTVNSMPSRDVTITGTTADGKLKGYLTVTVSAAAIPVTSVVINEDSVNVTNGTSYNVIATVNPNNATNNSLAWTSDNESVATVNNSGLVTTHSVGTANVKATSQADSTKYDSITINVISSNVAVTGVTIEESSHTIHKGSAYTVSAIVNPSNATNKNIDWSSSNTAIATVDNNGKVTAIAIGTATIKAQSQADSTKFDTITITVDEVPSGYLIADHTIMTKMYKGEIPLADIQNAKKKLKISYIHSSHGSQLTNGIDTYATWINTSSSIAPTLYKDAAANYFNRASSYDNGTSLYLYNRANLNIVISSNASSSNLNTLFSYAKSDANVFMVAWCGQMSTMSEEGVNRYLADMTALENANSNITFIYMTGHLSGTYSNVNNPYHGTGTASKLYRNNQIIRNYCKTNGKVLYDFADIESYAMDYDTNTSHNINYMELNANCAAWYEKTGDPKANFAIEWQNNNANKYFQVSNINTGHTQHMIYNQKAYAAWWLFTELAKRIP